MKKNMKGAVAVCCCLIAATTTSWAASSTESPFTMTADVSDGMQAPIVRFTGSSVLPTSLPADATIGTLAVVTPHAPDGCRLHVSRPDTVEGDTSYVIAMTNASDESKIQVRLTGSGTAGVMVPDAPGNSFSTTPAGKCNATFNVT